MSGKKVCASVLAEMRSRCHPKQKDEFLKFIKLHDGYKQRVDRFPEFLPKLDWDYFRRNVRQSAIPLVDEFKKKYEELNKVFNSRHELDTCKYYAEVEKEEEEVKKEISKFKMESNKRIKELEDEFKRLSNLKPYIDMTMEEYMIACPDVPLLINSFGRPSFWPHTADEQSLETPVIHVPDDDAVAEKKTKEKPEGDPATKSDLTNEDLVTEAVQLLDESEKKRKQEDSSKATSGKKHGSECDCPKCTAKRKLRLVKDGQQTAEKVNFKNAPVPDNVKSNPAKTTREEAAAKLRLVKKDEKDKNETKPDGNKVKKDDTTKKPDDDDDKKPK